MLHSLLRRFPKREDEDDDECPIALPDRPGAPSYPWWQLNLLYQTFQEGDDIADGVRSNFIWNLDCLSFVTNTFRRLEAPLADMGFRPVRAVGPLAPRTPESAEAGRRR